MQGRKIQTLFQDRVEGGMPYQVQVEGDNLPDGLYIIRLISDNDMVQTRKLMIQH
ncbi:MAG: T9SS type A sorting domain-containing protein [Sphingobacteriales bacterium]|nr:T9SS type A sorting domain-containing protein [Sphingobacteriales bacterium]